MIYIFRSIFYNLFLSDLTHLLYLKNFTEFIFNSDKYDQHI